ncbi:RnfH family protein [Guyparkeria halopsychrophila]|uniref:RnfH family protein n=1 Tax=Guyparkeria halopsychrophila TaxID=3139421 RepID=UPI0037CCB16F
MLLEVDVAEGATVEEAIRRSGILERFPEIDLSKQKVGVFAKVAPLSQVLREWDRVEIYRPLIADPKAARRQRAQKDGARARNDGARAGRKAAPSKADDKADKTASDTKKPAE